MKAIVQDKYGAGGDVLTIREIDKPAIAGDELLVRVRAASVHADIWHSVTGRPYSRPLLVWWCSQDGHSGTPLPIIRIGVIHLDRHAGLPAMTLHRGAVC